MKLQTLICIFRYNIIINIVRGSYITYFMLFHTAYILQLYQGM